MGVTSQDFGLTNPMKKSVTHSCAVFWLVVPQLTRFTLGESATVCQLPYFAAFNTGQRQTGIVHAIQAID